MKIDSALLTMITEEISEYRDDLNVFWDTIDGETDVMDAVGSVLEEIIDAQANEAAIKLKLETYKQLAEKQKFKQDSLKRLLMTVLKATDQRKIPHKYGTVSLREGTESVAITNEKEIPSQLCKVTVTPDKAEIKKQLKAGVQIDGAELVTGPQTISIRMK